MADESSNSSAVRKPESQAERRGSGQDEAASSMLHSYNLPDYRLEAPEFALPLETTGEQAGYRVEEDLTVPAPPLPVAAPSSRHFRDRTALRSGS